MSLLMASDSGETAGIWSQSAEMVNNGLMIGEKRQDVPVKLPNSS